MPMARTIYDIFEAHVYRLFNEKITSNPKTSNYRKINKKWDSVETSYEIHCYIPTLY